MGSFKPNEYGLFDVPGNGVRIGIAVSVETECCGAGLGTALLAPCAWLTATTATLRLIGTPTSGFDVLRICLNPLLNRTQERPLPLSISDKDGSQALQN